MHTSRYENNHYGFSEDSRGPGALLCYRPLEITRGSVTAERPREALY